MFLGIRGANRILFAEPFTDKVRACFLCLPVDHPPMEPSQFVSVVPKYPDKMGFDEVGMVCVHVHTCTRAQHAYVFILEAYIICLCVM